MTENNQKKRGRPRNSVPYRKINMTIPVDLYQQIENEQKKRCELSGCNVTIPEVIRVLIKKGLD